MLGGDDAGGVLPPVLVDLEAERTGEVVAGDVGPGEVHEGVAAAEAGVDVDDGGLAAIGEEHVRVDESGELRGAGDLLGVGDEGCGIHGGGLVGLAGAHAHLAAGEHGPQLAGLAQIAHDVHAVLEPGQAGLDHDILAAGGGAVDRGGGGVDRGVDRGADPVGRDQREPGGAAAEAVLDHEALGGGGDLGDTGLVVAGDGARGGHPDALEQLGHAELVGAAELPGAVDAGHEDAALAHRLGEVGGDMEVHELVVVHGEEHRRTQLVDELEQRGPVGGVDVARERAPDVPVARRGTGGIVLGDDHTAVEAEVREGLPEPVHEVQPPSGRPDHHGGCCAHRTLLLMFRAGRPSPPPPVARLLRAPWPHHAL